MSHCHSEMKKEFEDELILSRIKKFSSLNFENAILSGYKVESISLFENGEILSSDGVFEDGIFYELKKDIDINDNTEPFLLTVTENMRSLYFKNHGTYASDTIVRKWYKTLPDSPYNNEMAYGAKYLNKYQRKVNSTTIDVYDVLKAFEVNNQATAHAVKKLLASGQRGYKDVVQDLQEAIQSIERAIELESGD